MKDGPGLGAMGLDAPIREFVRKRILKSPKRDDFLSLAEFYLLCLRSSRKRCRADQ